MRTAFTGPDKCLDIVNDGQNNKPTMAACGNFTGQMWSIARGGDDARTLQTAFTGPNKCLDIVNDGQNNKPTMATCGNFTGRCGKSRNTRRQTGAHAGAGFVGRTALRTIARRCLSPASAAL